METRARYFLVGLFTLAVIVAGFGFVYWLHNRGGLGERALYRIRFESSVSGLRTGSAVLFNGIRVGEVTALQLDAGDPRSVIATVGIERGTPVRADTQVGVETQGLMGAPAILLTGGAADAPAIAASGGAPPLLAADPAASQDTMQAARQVLRRVDQILAENAEPLRSTIANLDSFTGALARNSGRVDGIVDALERMLAPKPPLTPAVYDLAAASAFPGLQKVPDEQLAVSEPTSILALDTQRILVRAASGETSGIPDAQWSDSIPRLVHARIVQSFENAKYPRVARPLDGFAADFQLTIDIRRFALSGSSPPQAEIEIGAKLLNKEGAIVKSRIFSHSAAAQGTDAASATAALDAAFRQVATDLVLWTSSAIAQAGATTE